MKELKRRFGCVWTGLALALLQLAAAALLPSQRAGLLQLYADTRGATWTKRTNWLVGDPCEQRWFGVHCSADNTTVLSLLLASNNLNGTFSQGVLALNATLQTLDLSFNALSSTIPAELGSMLALRQVNLRENNLRGSIPSTLSQLTQLTELDLSSNQLSSTIPPLMFPALSKLNLALNALSGGVPISLAGMSSLRVLELESNSLSGPLPIEFAVSPILELSLYDNRFSGPFPTFLASCNLTRLLLQKNAFGGALPDFVLSETALLAVWPDLASGPGRWDFSHNAWTQPTPSWCSEYPIGNGLCSSTTPRNTTCWPRASFPRVAGNASLSAPFPWRDVRSSFVSNPAGILGALVFVDSIQALPPYPQSQSTSAASSAATEPDVISARLLATPGSQPLLAQAYFAAQSDFHPAETSEQYELDTNAGLFALATTVALESLVEFEDADGDGAYSPGVDRLVSTFALDTLSWWNPVCIGSLNSSAEGEVGLRTFNVSNLAWNHPLRVSVQAQFTAATAVTADPMLIASNTPAQTILTANATRFEFEIADFEYVEEGTLLAISVLVATSGHAKDKRVTSFAGWAAAEPDEDGADNDGDCAGQLTVSATDPLDESAPPLSMYVCWNRSALVDGAAGAVRSSPAFAFNATVADLRGLARNVFFDATLPSEVAVRRLYFTPRSLAQPQPNSAQPALVRFGVTLGFGSPAAREESSRPPWLDAVAIWALSISGGLLVVGAVGYWCWQRRRRRGYEDVDAHAWPRSNYRIGRKDSGAIRL